jgi:hypothetical protein
MRAVYSYEHRSLAEYTEVSAERYPDVTLRNAVKGYALTAFTALMMSALVAVGLTFRPQGRAVLGLPWVSLVLFMLYVLNSWILFEHAHYAEPRAATRLPKALYAKSPRFALPLQRGKMT